MTSPAPDTRTARPSVMVIDSDRATAEVVGRYLLRAGYEIRTAQTASSALSLHGERPADLIALDLGASGLASLEVLRRMRAGEQPALGVVLIVDREHQVQRDAGLAAGADDYVVKPFSPRELVARVDATLRRCLPRSSPPSQEPLTLTAGDLQIDVAGRRVQLAGTEIHLAQKEFDLLLFFAQRPGVAHSRRADAARLGPRGVLGYLHRHGPRQKTPRQDSTLRRSWALAHRARHRLPLRTAACAVMQNAVEEGARPPQSLTKVRNTARRSSSG